MKQRTWILIFAALSAALLAVWLLRRSGGELAAIYQDGRRIAVLDLKKDTTMTVTGPAGENEITVSGGEVRVTRAGCPDQICVKHGPLRRNGSPIVCLPNRLSIEWLRADDAPDAVSGGGG